VCPRLTDGVGRRAETRRMDVPTALLIVAVLVALTALLLFWLGR
jgi:hypothetical protein